MAAGDTVTGVNMTFKYGAGPTVANHVGKFKIKKSVESASYATNSTAGWKKATVGVKSFSGTMSVMLHDGAALEFTVGSTIDADFYYTATDYYEGSITISDIDDPEVDAESAAPLSVDITFLGNGALTVGGGTLVAV